MSSKRVSGLAVATVAALALAGCGQADSGTGTGGPIAGLDQLAGKRVAVVTGVIEESYLTQKYPRAQLVEFAGYDQAWAALRNHSVDAWFTDRPIAEKYLAEPGADGLKIRQDVPENDTPDAFAVRKGNTALRAELDAGLDEVIADGTWLKLHQQFLPNEPVPAQFKPNAAAISGVRLSGPVIGVQQSGVLQVGTLSDAPPNVYLDGSDFTGFDNELIKAIAAKLGLRPEFSATQFESLLGQVQSGRFDVGSSAIATTPARKQTVDFTDPYNVEYMSLVS